MTLKTDGIVIKERPIGEKDKVITILTRTEGIIEAIARGVRNTKSRLLSGVSLFTYSDFSIFKGKTNFIIDSAEEKVSFHGVSSSLEKTALCFYFSSVCLSLTPSGEESEAFLRLFLNSLYLLEKDLKEHSLVKAVFELKLMEYGGFSPNLTACSVCGVYEDNKMFLSLQSGELLCSEHKTGMGEIPLTSKVLTAFRFVYFNEIEKAFGFQLDDLSLKRFSSAAEMYLLAQTGERFKTLDFYKSIVGKE